MGTYTTKYSLYKPSMSESNWGEEINSNLDAIDKIRDCRSIVWVSSTGESSPYYASSDDEFIVILYPGVAVDVYLPEADTVPAGYRMVIIAYSWTSNADVRVQGTDTLDGSSSGVRTYTSGAGLQVVSDGVGAWWIINRRDYWSNL